MTDKEILIDEILGYFSADNAERLEKPLSKLSNNDLYILKLAIAEYGQFMRNSGRAEYGDYIRNDSTKR